MATTHFIKFNFFLLLFFISTLSYAQSEYITIRDLESWSSLHVKHQINKKWTTALQGQLRLEENSSQISQYFGQFDIEYQPFKHFEFAAAVRYVRKNDHIGKVQGYENHIRYHFDAAFKHKSNRFKFKYRFRYQNKNELKVKDISKEYLRLKLRANYNIKKWKLDPELSGELFHSVGIESKKQLEGYRITFGTTFKVHKAAKIKLFYRYEQGLNTIFPLSRNIIGIKYTYTLK